MPYKSIDAMISAIWERDMDMASRSPYYKVRSKSEIREQIKRNIKEREKKFVFMYSYEE